MGGPFISVMSYMHKVFDATVYWQTWQTVWGPVKVVEEPGVIAIAEAVGRNEPVILGGFSESKKHYGFLTQKAVLDDKLLAGNFIMCLAI